MNSLGVFLGSSRDPAAEKLLRDALAGRRKVLGPQDKDTLESAGNLGYFLGVEGKMEESESLLREMVTGFRKTLGNRDTKTFEGLMKMGDLLHKQHKLKPDSSLFGTSKLTEAENMYREAREGYIEVLGKRHLATLTVTNVLGNVLYDQDKLWKATDILYEALKGCRESVGAKGALTKIVSQNLAKVLNKRGLAAEAAGILRECGGPPQEGVKSVDELIVDGLADDLEDQRKIYGAMHENTLYAAAALADSLLAYGRVEEAESIQLEYGV